MCVCFCMFESHSYQSSFSLYVYISFTCDCHVCGMGATCGQKLMQLVVVLCIHSFTIGCQESMVYCQ